MVTINRKGARMLNSVSLEATENELMTLIEVADFLGLDYFHARKILLSDKSIGYYEYGRKKLWKRTEILNLKQKHYVTPTQGE